MTTIQEHAQAENLWQLPALPARLTLRQQYAMQAPPVPSWFRPTLPPRPDECVTFRVWRHSLPIEEGELVKKYYDSETNEWTKWEKVGNEYQAVDATNDVPAELRQKVATFIEQNDKAYKAAEQWGEAEPRETFFQWRWYYADMMLNEPGQPQPVVETPNAALYKYLKLFHATFTRAGTIQMRDLEGSAAALAAYEQHAPQQPKSKYELPKNTPNQADQIIKVMLQLIRKMRAYIYPVASDPEPYKKVFAAIDGVEKMCEEYYENK